VDCGPTQLSVTDDSDAVGPYYRDAVPASVTVAASDPVRVPFSHLGFDHRQLRAMASERSAQMAGRTATYGHSGGAANYVGLLGEIAVQRWLEGKGEQVEELYRLPDSEGDLQLVSNKMTLEVKTNRLQAWRTYGASISMRQLDTIAGGGGLVWCVTGPELPPSAVYLMGWVSAPDLVERVEPWFDRGRILLRISRLDSPTTCVDWLAAHTERRRWARNQAVYECARRHRGVTSVCLDCWWASLGGPEFRRVRGTAHSEGCTTLGSFSWTAGLDEALRLLAPCADCMPEVLARVESNWANGAGAPEISPWARRGVT